MALEHALLRMERAQHAVLEVLHPRRWSGAVIETPVQNRLRQLAHRRANDLPSSSVTPSACAGR